MTSMRENGRLQPSSWRLVDVAVFLGVSKQRAHQLAAEKRFPSPAGQDAWGRYWRPSDIRAWAREWVKERPWRVLAR
jgi:predicted DNA-binding transcriptional regulator AlpA